MIETLIVMIVVVVAVAYFLKRNRRYNPPATKYDGTDAWKEESGHFPPTEKQLDFIDDLEDEIYDLNDDRDNPIRLPRLPRNPTRAIASDYIDALLRIRDKLEAEADEFEDETRYRPASIGSRGGLRLEGPDPILTDIEDAKRHLATLNIDPRRTPCVASAETGQWQPVWVAVSEDPNH